MIYADREQVSVFVRLKKLTAVSILFSFTFNQILFAHVPETSVWSERQRAQPSSRHVFGRDSRVLHENLGLVPKERTGTMGSLAAFSTLRETYKGGSGTSLLIIQDIHLNTEAQANIVKMFDVLKKEGRLGTIATEGVSGKFNFAQFFAPGNESARKVVAQAFLNDKRIAAPSYFGVTAQQPNANVFGVDDESLYARNVQAYVDSSKKQKELVKNIEIERRAVAEQKRKIFNADLMRLDSIVDSYQAGSLPLGKFLPHLTFTSPALKKFAEAYALEQKIDFDRVARERRSVMEVQALSVSQKKMFGDYLRYVDLANSINADELVRELQAATKASLLVLAKTPAERELLQASRALVLKTHLVKFSLTPEEWKEIRGLKGVGFKPFDDFYSLADSRSEKMVENLLNESSKPSVLVIGGFHTPGVTAALKKRGIGYSVLTPKVTKLEDSDSSYLSIFTREKTPIEKLFAGEKLTILPQQVLIGGNGRLAQQSNDLFRLELAFTELAAQIRAMRIHRYQSTVGENIAYTNIQGQDYYGIDPTLGINVPKGFERHGLITAPDGTRVLLLERTSKSIFSIEGLKGAVQALKDVNSVIAANRYTITLLAGLVLFASTGKTFFLGIAALPFIFGLTIVSSPVGASNWVEENTPGLAGKNIIEVTMEMALPDAAIEELSRRGATDDELRAVAMASSTGGIGPLLHERVIAQSNLGAHVTAVSLLYDKVWVQKFKKDKDGHDIINLEKVEVGHLLRNYFEKMPFTIDLEMYDESIVTAEVYRAPTGLYGRANVYFLYHPSMTEVVYPGERDFPDPQEPEKTTKRRQFKETSRLQQNWLVGRGTLALLEKLNEQTNVAPDVIVMSEMPTVFVHHRMFLDRFSEHPLFRKASYIFNDHTPLEYAHPKWMWHELKNMRLDPRYYEGIPSVWGSKDGERAVDGTAMIINAADAVYGVAKKHGEVMRRMPLLNEFASKIDSITNGVSPKWMAKEFGSIENVKRLSNTQLLEIKNKKRMELFRWIEKRNGMRAGWADDMIAANNPIGLWTRRIVGYKRMDVFTRLIEDEHMREEFLKSGIVFVIGGRIHQDDTFGQDHYARIQKVVHRDPRLKDFVVFFDNYNTWEAKRLMQGVDFSTMLADDGYEASATGFQKALSNGALIIASRDGAVPESVVFYEPNSDENEANGFEVPYVSQFNPENGAWKMGPTPQGLLHAFSSFRHVFNEKETLGRMVRNAFNLSPRVDVTRTAIDMLTFFEDVIEGKEIKDSYFQNGRLRVREIISGINFEPGVRERIIGQLELVEGFSWKYLRYGHDEQILPSNLLNFRTKPDERPDRGLAAMAAAVAYIRSIGTVGEWSLAYHAANHGGIGDIPTFFSEAIAKIPELAPLRDAVLNIGEAAKTSNKPQHVLNLNRIILGMMEALVESLRERIPIRQEETGKLSARRQVRLSNLLRSKIQFETPVPRLQQLDHNKVGASIRFHLENHMIPRTEFFIHWGEVGKPNWQIVHVNPEEIHLLANNVSVLSKTIDVIKPGRYGVTVFAVPKGVGADPKHDELRVYSASYFGEVAEFQVHDEMGVQMAGHSPAPVPGAIGILPNSKMSFADRGAAEGAATSVLGMALFAGVNALVALRLAESHVIAASFEPFVRWSMATAITLIVSFALIYAAHRALGVKLPGQKEPSFDQNSVWSATRAASVSLFAPLLASFAVFAPMWATLPLVGVGFAAGTLLHREKNRPADYYPLTNAEAKLAKSYAQRTKTETSAEILARVSKLTEIRNAELVTYTTERQNLYRHASAHAAEPLNAFAREAARSGARPNVKVLSLDKQLKTGDIGMLVPQANNAAELAAEIRAALKLAQQKEMRQVSVYMIASKADIFQEVRNPDTTTLTHAEIGAITFIDETAVDTNEEIAERLLDPTIGTDGKFDLLVHGAQALPKALAQSLAELGRTEKYANKVKLSIADEISANARAMEFSDMRDIEALLKFFELVGKYA